MLLTVRFLLAFVILLSGICVAQTPSRVKATSVKPTPAKSTPVVKTTYKAPAPKPTAAKPAMRIQAAAYRSPATRAVPTRAIANKPRPTPARTAYRAPVRHYGYYYQTAPSPERYREIQQALINQGFLTGPATGVWNQESIDALNRFKKEQNLRTDGKLDSLSLIALGLGPKRPAEISTANLPLPSPAVTQALEH